MNRRPPAPSTLDAPAARQMAWMFAQQTREHAIVVIDREGRIAWFSPGAEHIFGYEAARVVGRPTSVLFTPEDVESGIDRLEFTVASFHDAAEDDRWPRRADGSRFWEQVDTPGEGKGAAFGVRLPLRRA